MHNLFPIKLYILVILWFSLPIAKCKLSFQFEDLHLNFSVKCFRFLNFTESLTEFHFCIYCFFNI